MTPEEKQLLRAKITREQAAEIIDLYAQRLPQWKIAERYGLSQQHVCDILRGMYWKELPRPDFKKRRSRRKYSKRRSKRLKKQRYLDYLAECARKREEKAERRRVREQKAMEKEAARIAKGLLKRPTPTETKISNAYQTGIVEGQRVERERVAVEMDSLRSQLGQAHLDITRLRHQLHEANQTIAVG